MIQTKVDININIVSIHREKVSKYLGRLQNNCQLDPLEFYAVQ